MVDELLKKYAPISDQVSRDELRIILTEFAKILDAEIPGDVVEFGCYKGTTSLFLARILRKTNSGKKLFLYDSFAGLPEKSPEDLSQAGDDFQAGELVATKRELVQAFAKNNLLYQSFGPIIIKSWFSDIRDDQLPEKISFAFFDGDFYRSIRDSFAKCAGKFSSGATIIVDDYVNEKLPGAAKAVDEWIMGHRQSVAKFWTEKSLGIVHLK